MKNMKNKILIISLSLFGFIGSTNAQTCAVAPTCDALGYTKTVAECTGHTTLTCPFDNTKVYCDLGCLKEKTYKIGDKYNGGTVFEVNSSGTSGKYVVLTVSNGTHTEAANVCISANGRLPTRNECNSLKTTYIKMDAIQYFWTSTSGIITGKWELCNSILSDTIEKNYSFFCVSDF